jgi:hypothetical protein
MHWLSMSVVFRLHSSALIRAEDLRQLSMPLGHRDILERVPPFQSLVEEEEAESSNVLLYRACIELLVLEQVCLVLAQVLRSELVGWLVEVLGEVLHDSQVAFLRYSEHNYDAVLLGPVGPRNLMKMAL